MVERRLEDQGRVCIVLLLHVPRLVGEGAELGYSAICT